MSEEKKVTGLPTAYWEIQRRQARVSLGLFSLLFIFYLLTIGLLTGIIFSGLGFLWPTYGFFTGHTLVRFAWLTVILSLVITFFNFRQAKKEGVRYILNNLGAYYPDPEDRYHLMFINILEQMKLASGLTELHGYVIPSLNLNSLSLLDTDGQPAVAVTEGLLAEASRDELEAVVAHETAHILKGDTYTLTIICSLAAFYEKLFSATQRKNEEFGHDVLLSSGRKQTWSPALYLGSFLSSALLSFLITVISRNRELLADATAVELGRHPEALARIIYKAHLANSFLGEFSLFTPLFLVPPDSREISDSLWDRLFNTHPPVLRRIQLLAAMNHKNLKDIVEEIKQQETARQYSRTEIKSAEEWPEEKKEFIRQQKEMAEKQLLKDRSWLVKTPDQQWAGPFHLAELISLPYFTPALRIKNLKENLEAPAREFPQVRFALYRQIKNQPLQVDLTSRCPTCHSSLTETFYEGVKIKHCPVCHGKLVKFSEVEKIFARREYKFSDAIKARAEQWQKIMFEPGQKKPSGPAKKTALCPECGLQMMVKPFSYHLVMPVYKCLKCQVIWFEADELEVLQAIIEKKPENS
ncbi:MAG: M48 family metalloprotease [Candidatus Saccharicenans sp.]